MSVVYEDEGCITFRFHNDTAYCTPLHEIIPLLRKHHLWFIAIGTDPDGKSYLKMLIWWKVV